MKRQISQCFYNLFGRISPKWVANRRYRKKFGRNIDWNNPIEFNEKIRWMQFYTDTSLWSLLADKYRVRNYLEKQGFSELLVKLYHVWDTANDIDFESLPDSFVLKTNHGYGEVIIVTNKQSANLEEIRHKIQKYLDTPFGYETAEPHYLRIKPVIIAEELLPNDSSFSTSIVDYKFYCFHGKPYCCGVFYDRNTNKNATFYDMNWNRHDEWRAERLRNMPQKDVPCPTTLTQMINACEKLASPFPFVRMDFYESNGKLYFGEFTFTPAALSGGSLSEEVLDTMAHLF